MEWPDGNFNVFVIPIENLRESHNHFADLDGDRSQFRKPRGTAARITALMRSAFLDIPQPSVV